MDSIISKLQPSWVWWCIIKNCPLWVLLSSQNFFHKHQDKNPAIHTRWSLLHTTSNLINFFLRDSVATHMACQPKSNKWCLQRYTNLSTTGTLFSMRTLHTCSMKWHGQILWYVPGHGRTNPSSSNQSPASRNLEPVVTNANPNSLE